MDTPYFLCDGVELERNCEIVRAVRERSGCRIYFAIKSCSVSALFPYMADCFDGLVSSSLYETRLGRERFCSAMSHDGEVHTYSPAFKESEIGEVLDLSECVVFNSHSQLERFGDRALAAGVDCGLRLNPEFCGRPGGQGRIQFTQERSRLGVVRDQLSLRGLERASGVLFHVNSENGVLDRFRDVLERIEHDFGDVLSRRNIRWISLGGGIDFTRPDYPAGDFADDLRAFAERYHATVYLEPGSAIISSPFTLHAAVLDVVHNQMPIAVLDMSAYTHLPDRLLYGLQYPVAGAEIPGDLTGDAPGVDVALAGVSCAGEDELGIYRFARPLEPGDTVVFQGVGDYTIVQQNFFNGVNRPSIYYRSPAGRIERLKRFGYEDYLGTC